jgi:hypothetical protein
LFVAAHRACWPSRTGGIGALRGNIVMAISATCANGHVLKVKDEYAGKTGLCPHCRSRVFVPMPIFSTDKARISDDEILSLLGGSSKPKTPIAPIAPADSALEPVHDGATQGSGTSLLGTSVVGKHKVCPHCAYEVSLAFTHCPRCGTPLPELPIERKPHRPGK